MSSPGGPTFDPSVYDEDSPYMQAIQQGINESSGYQREALSAQMESAKEARANAMKIAQLQAATSRYGIDAQSATAMRELKEKARQFDADHGLEIAKAYTAFSSTPDLMWARSDFLHAMGRVGQGLNPQPIASNPTQPHAKTWEDFAAISQDNGSTIPGASSGGGSGGGGTAQAQTSGGGSAADPRVSAANAIMKAAPPSATAGADGQDWGALNAIRNMYELAQPGSVERLGPQREKIALAGMARLGYDPKLVAEEYRRTRPGQMSPRLA